MSDEDDKKKEEHILKLEKDIENLNQSINSLSMKKKDNKIVDEKKEDDILKLEKDIENNNQRIKLLSMKKEQSDQMKKLGSKGKGMDDKYITKNLAAQSVVTYLNMINPYIMGIAFFSVFGLGGSFFVPMVGLGTYFILIGLAIYTIIKIHQTKKQLISKYSLAGARVAPVQQPAQNKPFPKPNQENMQEAMKKFFGT